MDFPDVLHLQDVHDLAVIQEIEQNQQAENPDVPNNHGFDDEIVVERFRINPYSIPDARFKQKYRFRKGIFMIYKVIHF